MHTVIRDRSRKLNRRGETYWPHPRPDINHTSFLLQSGEARLVLFKDLKIHRSCNFSLLQGFWLEASEKAISYL